MMDPVGCEPQGLRRTDACERQVSVEMGKQRAAARGFPFERRSEGGRIDRNEHEIVLPGEMLRGRLAHLLGGGEMDVAVGAIDRGAAEDAVALRLLPQRTRADLVD